VQSGRRLAEAIGNHPRLRGLSLFHCHAQHWRDDLPNRAYDPLLRVLIDNRDKFKLFNMNLVNVLLLLLSENGFFKNESKKFQFNLGTSI
jgi:hypothetical protein